MKKILLSLTVLLTSAFAIGAQEALTVYDGTVTSNTVPAYIFYWDAYTRSQVVIPAADLEDMAGGTISAIKFYTSLTEEYTTSPSADVYLMEVNYNEISAFEPKENGTVVYSNNLTIDENGELTIEFTQPFNYSGGNLLIGIENDAPSGYMSAYFYGQAVPGASVAGYNYTSTDAVQPSQKNFIPKTTFTYTPGELPANAAAVNTNELKFGKVYVDNEVEMKVVLRNKGSNAFTPAISGLEAPFSTTYEAAELASRQRVEIPVKFAPTEFGEYTGTMTINCGEAGTFTVALSGNCPNEKAITICEGDTTSKYAPVYGTYVDVQGTFTQMLYPADKFADLVGAKITGVKFYPKENLAWGTPTIELSVKGTEETAFEAESAISVPTNLVTDLTTVASVTLAGGETELEFTFNEPYTYEGGNLAVQTLVAASGSWKSIFFNGEAQEANTAYAQWGSSSGSNALVMFLPKMTILYTKDEQPQPEKAYYLIGDFNEWNQEEMVPFVEEDGVFTLTKTFSGQFKIKDEQGKWWGGGATLTAENPSVELDDTDGSDTNLVLAEEAEYTLTIEDGVLTVTGFPEPVIPEYSEFYVVGDFNEWNQTEDGGRVELVGNEEGTEYTGSVEMQAEQKFKVITPNPNPTSDDDQWIWFGGADENEMGYFLINNDMLNVDISLIDGANFQVQAGGEYTITVKAAQADGTRAVQEPLVMVVTMKPTAITTISSDMNNDNAWYGINGIRYENRPTVKGVYIHNGKKVVIK